ncbi:hypothetical protein Syun_018938 [Stephania yunnanensis]|uniref:Uncharacterized protein n=1 Tax=Stephania yunnanensis TaxID=152371 RepID=A0AAP0IVI9_9MAGN
MVMALAGNKEDLEDKRKVTTEASTSDVMCRDSELGIEGFVYARFSVERVSTQIISVCLLSINLCSRFSNGENLKFAVDLDLSKEYLFVESYI